MRTVLAIQLRLPPRAGQTANQVVSDVRSRVEEWVSSKYDRTWRTPVAIPFNGSASEPIAGHKLTSTRWAVADVELLTLEWTHPHDTDASSAWHTTVLLGKHGEDVDFSTIIRIATVRMTMRPVSYTLGRPRIVTQMIDDYAALMSDWPVPSSHEIVKPSNVQRFVEGTLLASGRSLPVVVLTPDVWSERFLVDPEVVFDVVKGFAHVVVMESKWAAFKLTDLLEKELSCFNGAARVYWPGFTLTANPLDHRLYLPANLTYWKNRGVSFGRHLFRGLAAISAFRFVEGTAIRAARKAIAESESAALSKLAEEVKQGHATKEDLETQLLEFMLTIDQLRKDKAEIKAELDAQKAAWGEYRLLMAEEEKEEEPPAEQTATCVLDVVASVKQDYPASFVFLNQAEDHAKDSPFNKPELVDALFAALAELVDQWKKGESLGSTWKEALSEKGFDYKPDISQTCRQKKYVGEYQGMYEGKKVTFGEHVTFGKGQDPQKCMSVHWWRDDAKRLLVIGRCGKHGTNTLT